MNNAMHTECWLASQHRCAGVRQAVRNPCFTMEKCVNNAMHTECWLASQHRCAGVRLAAVCGQTACCLNSPLTPCFTMAKCAYEFQQLRSNLVKTGLRNYAPLQRNKQGAGLEHETFFNCAIASWLALRARQCLHSWRNAFTLLPYKATPISYR